MLLGASAEGKTIVVDDDWSGADHSTIQAALGAASPGDTIRVYDGTYNEANNIDIAINLVGNGTSSTIIDGSRKDHVFGFGLMGGKCNVSGFRFINWFPTHHYGGIGIYSSDNRVFDNYFYYNGRGIFLEATGNHISNNTFDANMNGVLVYRNADDSNISFNRFTRHYSVGLGYGESKGIEIFSNTFYNNNRTSMFVHRSSNVSISFNMFDNTAISDGSRYGLILFQNTDADVHNNTFLNNGRAITLGRTNNTIIANNTITRCDVGIWVYGTDHDGIFTTNGTIIRYNNLFGNNESINATANLGVGVLAENNWWGSDKGPYHYANNTGGAGDNVSDYVDFDPWLGKALVFPPIPWLFYIDPTLANEGELVNFTGRGLARNAIDQIHWRSSIEGVIYTGADTGFGLSDISNGTHYIHLKVRDPVLGWSLYEVNRTLVVNGIPIARIMSINPDDTNEGVSVSFQGGYVDHEDNVTELLWRSDVDGVIGRALTFSTANLSNGTHLISFRVKDGYGVWSPNATDTVTVNGLPRAWIDSITPDRVNESEPVIFRGNCTDHEGPLQGFLWESSIDGTLSDQRIFYTSHLSNGTHRVTFAVMDTDGVWSQPATATVVVNGLPQAHIDDIVPDPANEGEEVTFYGNYTDHEDEVSQFQWSSDVDGPLSTELVFTTTSLSNGTHLVTFRVLDGFGVWSDHAWRTLVVNGAPRAIISNVTPLLVNEGGSVGFEGDYFDDDHFVAEFSWSSDLDGVLSSSRDFSTTHLSVGAHVISFRVRDNDGAWSASATATVVVNGIPVATIASILPSSSNESEEVELIGDYADAEGIVVAFSWVSDIDGVLSTEQAFSTSDLTNGTHTIRFRVRDHHGAWSSNASATLTVNGLPRARILSTWSDDIYLGDAVELRGEGTDDGRLVAFSWRSSIDHELGSEASLTLTELSPGTHLVSFRVRDDLGSWSAAVVGELVVLTHDPEAEVLRIDHLNSAIEGQNVTLEALVRNPGRIPLDDLTVRFYVDNVSVGSARVGGSVGPGSELTVGINWTAVTGTHAVRVEVEHLGSVIGAGASEGTILVEALPEEPGPNGTDEEPSDTGLLIVLIVIVLVLAVLAAYLVRSRWG